MNKSLYRIAAVLAFIIGAMAIFAGSQVLLGRDPGYYVISWLPVYNLIIGLLSVIVAFVLIWRGSRYAIPAAVVILGLHILVFLTILIGYANVVATDSLVAMTIRIGVWLVILALLLIGSRQKSL